MDKKKACYICTGCGLGEALDIDALAGVSGEEGYPAKAHQALCSPEGLEFLKGEMASGVNCFALAACSPRVKTDVFNFTDVVFDRVNLREQALWVTKVEDDEDKSKLQELAEDYLRMAAAKLNAMDLPTPYQVENLSRKILVLGGGKSGLTAAVEAAKAGYEVVLVEKEPDLGGKMNLFKASTPLGAPWKDLVPTGRDELVQQVNNSDKIEVFTKAAVTKIVGAPGMFDVKISHDGADEERRCGAVVLATGWQPYDAAKLGPEYGVGHPNVITNLQFEEMVRDGKMVRPSDGGPIKTAVFIQCAGSRDKDHLPYCSAICCQVSMKQATYLKENDPEVATYIVYRDVRSPGQFEEFYRATQEKGVVFIRAKNRSVGNGFVEAEDEQMGEKVRIENVDLVVLAVGMVPTSCPTAEQLAKEAEDLAKKVAQGSAPAIVEHYGSALLNLAYRQSGELPLLKNGFVDSNFICFPYESRRTGVYACGPVRRPMGLAAAGEDATGAAMKAIQAIESVAAGRAVHPRAGDESFPEFAMQRCTQCKRCTEECPFGAINEDEKANPLPNPSRCRRCGVCMGACPERIISFKNYSVPMIGDMIKSIHVPEDYEERPRVIALVCENDAYPAIDTAAFKGYTWSPYVRFVSLRCLGSINLVWIADALSKGVDGIILFGCRHGDDYQCHFVRGSELASIRMSKIQETLQRLVLESERIRVEELSIVDHHRVPEIISEFMETIESVGPNPYKGF